MSYILDALRKAERDRNLGRTPSLGDVTTPVVRAPSRRLSTRTLALIGLVAALLICTVLLWPRRPASTPTTVASAAPAAPAPVAVAASPAPAPAPEIVTEPPPPVAGADGTLDPEVPADSIDDLMDEPEAPLAAPDASTASPLTSQETPATAAPATPVESAEPAPISEEAAAEPDVPLLRDMPADYRGAFPELRVDVHVYDDDPARRWVLVNGHKAVEGTTLTEGPTVSRITPEGIVFDFRGRSALFPLNR